MRRELEYTPERVEARLIEAARTLRLLPGTLPQTRLSIWPPILWDVWERCLGALPEPSRDVATPQEVTAMDEVLIWLLWLTVEQRRLLWMRALKLPWAVICERLHLSRTTARRHWEEALAVIVSQLNQHMRRSTYGMSSSSWSEAHYG